MDFISEKWRTVLHTRHLGYLHLALTIIPLPYIMFYAHLQQIAYDYKEMMAAVVVILMAIYHIIRTIWGLMQLDAYHIWCEDMAKRMLILKMVGKDKWGDMLKVAERSFWSTVKQGVYQFSSRMRKQWLQATNLFSNDEMEAAVIDISVEEDDMSIEK